MNGRYILKDKTPVPCDDISEWCRWFETANRHVAISDIDEAHVSTVFLGLDHRFGKGEALLFETMIFHGDDVSGNKFGDYCERCSTWE